MKQTDKLLAEVLEARHTYLQSVGSCSDQQAQWKEAPESWSIVEITEHLFWAEHGAILGMWKTLRALHEGKTPRKTASVHEQMPVETIIALTWQPKEQVPPVAAPRLGGPLSFWVSALQNLQNLLTDFAKELKEEDLRTLAHPHPISGDMDFQQRLEFLRFHIARHQQQAEGVLEKYWASI